MENPKRMKRTRRHAGPLLACLCAAVAVTAGGCGLFGPPKDVPEWKAKIEAKLEEPVTFEFMGAESVYDAIGFFRIRMGVNIVIDTPSLATDGLQSGITLTCNNVRIKDGLAACLRQAGLIYTVRDYAILVCTKERLKKVEARPKPVDVRSLKYDVHGDPITRGDPMPPRDRRFAEPPISFEFIATPLDDVVAFMGNLRRLNIIVDNRALADRGDVDITLRLIRVPFKTALDWICILQDLNYIITDDVICISTPERVDALAKNTVEYWHRPSMSPDTRKSIEAVMHRRVRFCFTETSLEDAASYFQNLTRVPFVVDKQAIGAGDHDVKRLRFDSTDVSLRSALTWICRLNGLAWVVTEGRVVITTPEAAQKLANPQTKPGTKD